mmetsp:Transcript_88713/g.129692  ORF Transcript_88713/g.129692 Transcript_88713/m.129692 type:complete len:206 (+) Transcript_88713:553-1170(+)
MRSYIAGSPSTDTSSNAGTVTLYHKADGSRLSSVYRVERMCSSCERRMRPSNLQSCKPSPSVAERSRRVVQGSPSSVIDTTGKPLCSHMRSLSRMSPTRTTTGNDTGGRDITSAAVHKSISHDGSCSRNLSFFLRSPISYTPSCPKRLPTNLAVHVVTTIGSRKWTLAVPSMIITTSEIVARCTPPSIAAAPASAYAPLKTESWT